MAGMANIIFDFDGTIADSFAIAIGIFHDLTHREEPITPDEIERLRGMSALKVAEELHIQPWKMPFLLIRGRRRMTKQMNNVHTFPGLQKTIRELHSQGHNMYIMSSNSAQNIQLFLQCHAMSKEFIKVYGNVGLFNKASVLRRVVRRNNLKRNETFYVGDEARDVEAAKRAGVKVVAVSWGYNNVRILTQHEPDIMVAEPGDLINVLE